MWQRVTSKPGPELADVVGDLAAHVPLAIVVVRAEGVTATM